MATPVMRWAGAKEWLLHAPLDGDVRSLFGIVKAHLGARGRLVEPFAGSAALTLSIMPQKGLLADTCEPLVSVYKSLQDDGPADLAENIASWARSYGLDGGAKAYAEHAPHEGFYRCRAAMNKHAKLWFEMDQHCDLAAHAVLLNRTCFNGLWRTNRKGDFNVPYGDRPFSPPTLEQLEAAARALECTEVEAMPWQQSLDFWKLKKGDVVYADPPYSADARGGFTAYGDKWNVQDDAKLGKALADLVDRGVKVIVSQPDTPDVQRFYNPGLSTRYEIHSIPKTYAVGGSARKRKALGELLLVSL